MVSQSKTSFDRFISLRNEIIDEIEKDVVGPREIDEIIPNSPTKKYLSGVLYPQNYSDPDHEEEKNVEVKNNKDSDDEESPIAEKSTRSSYPSSMGLTCKVLGNTDEIILEVEYAKYSKVKPEGWNYQRNAIKDKDGKTITVPIKLLEGDSPPQKVGNDIGAINYHIRKINENYSISVFLRNSLKQTSEKIDPTHCIYQPVLKLRSKNLKDKVFMATSSNEITENDSKDEQLFKLLLKHRRQFGLGHSCSATWNVNEREKLTNSVETTFIPKYEVPKIAANDNDDEIKNLEALDMKVLAEIEKFSEYEPKLSEIYKIYDKWIQHLEIPKDFQEIAENQIQECKEARDRIKEGIELISSEPEIGEAFRFANRVMLYQRSYSEWAKLSKEDKKLQNRSKPELKGKWRLFQLAFILLNIKSIAKPSERDRKLADVLWFPTGGGKTEAYLGIIAFTIALRRLRNEGIFKYGVTSIMRYTLRLLTLQQFQRATTFMCSCEVIRRADRKENGNSKWGSEPFQVGLWLGRTTTPNNLDGDNGAKSQLENVKKSQDAVKEANPYQIRSCPWCGESISPYDYDFGGQIEHMQIFCANKNCEFSREKSREETRKDANKNPIYEDRGLPVLLIDEDIYKLCPTLIIATVDKFAQISWKWETASIFGKINKFSQKKGFITSNNPSPPKQNVIDLFSKYGKNQLPPPELIIQDELHLISGPLGTLTSLYETAIDFMCKDDKGITPKIIASTATTRNSPEQIKRLFNIDRNKVKIFPPQGFSFGESYFAKEIPIEEEFGKIYLGVCPTSRTGLTILARVAAVILQTVRAFRNEKKYTDSELDPYYTVVSYFNSIKELANANRVFDDSVPDFMWMIQNKYDIVEQDEEENKESKKEKSKFTVSNLDNEELTGRKNANEIPDILEKLDVGLENGKPLDVLLCTNMIQVGVDIDRFGVMIINGQPKSTSEYIQASGRIGRKFPGLIISSYNYLKPRDLSHYENFVYYHSTFHQYVEPVSITPFSPRARDRGLLGIAVALMRLNSDLISHRKFAARFDINGFQQLVTKIKKSILQRVSNIESTEEEGTEKQLDRKIFGFWDKRAIEHKNLEFNKNLYEFAAKDPNGKYLMKPNLQSDDEESVLVPSSLREAEDEVKLKYYSPKFKEEN